jgi:hypothetical protein
MHQIMRRAGTPLALAAVATLAGVAPAAADDPVQTLAAKTSSCEAGGDTLFGSVQYTTDSGGAFVDKVSFTIQDNLAGHNNVYLRLRGNSGSTTYWAWTSGDDIDGEQTYNHYPEEWVPRSSNPYMKFHVDFDQSGSDPSCEFYINLY